MVTVSKSPLVGQPCICDCVKECHEEQRKRLTFPDLLYLLVVLHLRRLSLWQDVTSFLSCTRLGDEVIRRLQGGFAVGNGMVLPDRIG
jgi:hypothetical protein